MTVTWDAQLGRFRNARGQLIARSVVRHELDVSLANVVRLTDTLADDLRAGRISLNEWQAEMRDLIKQVHLGSAAIAKGGVGQMTQADYGRVGQKVRQDYGHLEKWIRQIKDGRPLGAEVESRSKMYLRAGRSTFLAVEAQEMADRGWLAKSTLHASESCAECIAEAAKGFVEPSFIVPPGSRTCLSNCRCVLVYQKAA